MYTFNPNTDLAIVQEFDEQRYDNSDLQLYVKRDDLLHREVSGNKWRKLKWNLKIAHERNCTTIATFGGAYSNHLLATACACKESGIKSIAYVRGQELDKGSNPILRRCTELGMELVFVSRSDYRELKGKNGPKWEKGEHIWFVPEGGANREGVKGCTEIMRETSNDFDYVCVAQGTTTTSLGIASTMGPKTKLVVVPVLKGFDSLKEMKKLALEADMYFDESKIIVLDTYHFGGYAKKNQELNSFIESFNGKHDFKIEPRYTGKAMYALYDFLSSETSPIKKVLFVHTGGLYNF